MLAQTSVYSTSAPVAASIASWKTSTDPPVSAAISAARFTTCGIGSNPGGVAMRTCMPAFAPASNNECATLLPVAEVRQRPSPRPAQPLADREQVGERLARMLEIREGVDDRDRGGGRQLLQTLLFERPKHHRHRRTC
jgi:hypothetical protein